MMGEYSRKGATLRLYPFLSYACRLLVAIEASSKHALFGGDRIYLLFL